MELNIAHCPNCGRVFQKNIRNLCVACSTEEDRIFQSTEQALKRNRSLSVEQLSESVGVPEDKIRGWIRSGKLRLTDYPNLADQCDLCKAPIRTGHLCNPCAKRLKSDIAHSMEQERLMQERLRAANSYISKR